MSACRWGALLTAIPLVSAQIQFEIDPEMLGGMFGGMMGGGGGGQRRKMTEWPKTENSDIAPEMEWLVNTEWKGKTAKYLLLRDGNVESPLKECEHEGMCLWAANGGRVLINTPTLKVIKFTVEGVDAADKRKLDNKDEAELKKIKLVAEKAGKGGKRSQLEFSRVAVAADAEDVIAKDLYKILDVATDADPGTIKSKYRRLSVQNHPDKGGDAKAFNEIREAYEILGDSDKRRYYEMGGIQLVKNIDTAWKEIEGQAAQLDAQLAQIPKDHPQYRHAKAQIDQQKEQLKPANVRHDIERKMRSPDLEVMVPIPVAELYNGVQKKEIQFKRLVICRGCRADPDSPECKECGRCPPEQIQVPKYANTPFGKQVVGMREKDQESLERCREVPMTVKDIRVPKGAKEGAVLKTVSDMGHQTPGKVPGKVVFKVSRGALDDKYTIAESDLYTVLDISLEEALYGFSKSWEHLGGEVTVKRDRAAPGEVVVLPNKGLVDGGRRGDLYVRLVVEMPRPAAGEALTLRPPAGAAADVRLRREDPVELKDGGAWRRWAEREVARPAQGQKAKKDEL